VAKKLSKNFLNLFQIKFEVLKNRVSLHSLFEGIKKEKFFNKIENIM